MANAKKSKFVHVITLILRWAITTFVTILVLSFFARWLLVAEAFTLWQVVGLYGCAALIGVLEVFRFTRVHRKQRLEMKADTPEASTETKEL